MKKGWQTDKLGEVCSLLNRGISPKYLESGGVCVLNQKCIREHKVSYELSRRHDIQSKKFSADKLIQIGDVLVNSTGVGTLGRVAQLREAPLEPTTVDSHVTIVRPIPGKFHPEFFGYMLIVIEDAIKESGEGCGGQTELARSVLSDKFTVNYPISIPEQQRIVGILDDAFARIATAKANTEKNLKNARALFDSYLDSVFTKRGEGWEEKKLGEVCSLVNRGISPKYLESGGICVLNQKCIREHKVSYQLSRRHDVQSKKISPEKLIQIGDVLVNSTGVGTLGRVAQLREVPAEATTVDSHVTIIRPISGTFHLEFFGYMLIMIEGVIKESGEGCGGQTELARSVLSNKFTVNYSTSISEQKYIVDILDEISSISKRLESIYQRKLDALDALKKSLLHQAFNGEL